MLFPQCCQSKAAYYHQFYGKYSNTLKNCFHSKTPFFYFNVLTIAHYFNYIFQPQQFLLGKYQQLNQQQSHNLISLKKKTFRVQKEKKATIFLSFKLNQVLFILYFWMLDFFLKFKIYSKKSINLKFLMLPFPGFYFGTPNIISWNQDQTMVFPFFLFSGSIPFEQFENRGKRVNLLNPPMENMEPFHESLRQKKKQRVELPKPSRNRNLCSLILKDFLKKMKQSPAALCEIMEGEKNQCLVKKFILEIKSIFPQQPGYLKPSFIKQICFSQERGEFPKLFRILLRHFLVNQYPIIAVEKKKKKLNHLKQCRILYKKIFSDR